MKKALLLSFTILLFSCGDDKAEDFGCCQVKKTNTLINDVCSNLDIERKRLNGECYYLQMSWQTDSVTPAPVFFCLLDKF